MGNAPKARAGVPSDGPMVQLVTRVTKALHMRTKLHAVESDKTVGLVVAEAIAAKLAKGKR